MANQRMDPAILSPSATSAPPGSDPTNELAILVRVMLAGKAVLGPRDIRHEPVDPDPRQERWNQFRLSICFAERLPNASLLLAHMPPAVHPGLEHFSTSSIVVRLASILDDELGELIDANALSIKRNARLNDRIEAVRAAGMLSSASALHALRHLRNSLGQETSPPSVPWHDVHTIADSVEAALIQLRVLSSPSAIAFEKQELSAMAPSARPGELYRRTLTTKFQRNGGPYQDTEWEYVYFEHPTWTP